MRQKTRENGIKCYAEISKSVNDAAQSSYFQSAKLNTPQLIARDQFEPKLWF